MFEALTCRTHNYVLPPVPGSNPQQASLAAPQTPTSVGQDPIHRLPVSHPCQGRRRLYPAPWLPSPDDLLLSHPHPHSQSSLRKVKVGCRHAKERGRGGRGSGLQRVTIATPINSQRCSRCVVHGHGPAAAATRRRCPCCPRRVDRACVAATPQGLMAVRATKDGAERTSL